MKTLKVSKYVDHQYLEESKLTFSEVQDLIEGSIKIELSLGVRDMGYTSIEAQKDGYKFTGTLHTISDLEVRKLKALLNHGKLPPHAAIVIYEILKES